MSQNSSLSIAQYLGILFYITIGVFISWKFILPKYSNTIFVPSIPGEITNSGIIQTGSGEPTTILDNIKEHRLDILTGSLSVSSLDISTYPNIQVNSKITKGTILFEIEPIDSIKNYDYFMSNSYFFAFRFFIGDFQNGGYYNVFRKANNGVGNDVGLGLNGAISGKNLSDGFVWAIPLDTSVKIAKDRDGYGYGIIDTLSIINNNVGNEVRIGGFLSSIKEFPEGGWKITNIKSISIIYEGDKDALSLR